MNRSEHIAWCKERALEYVNNDSLGEALASMASDLNKHDETRGHPAIEMSMQLMMRGSLSTQQEMRKFIEGFN